MKRFTTLEELRQAGLTPAIGAILKKVLQAEHEIAYPRPYDPEAQGCVWLLQSTDTDETVAEVFGIPLLQLSFDQVRYHPDDAHFLCHYVRNNSRCDTLVIPDNSWLADDWRAWLLNQL